MAGMEKLTDPENPYAGQGAVLLDIGGNVGALVVTMPESLQGREVEVRAVHASPGAGEHSHRHPHRHPHVGVVGRPTDSGIVYSLVFPAVIEGEYDLALLPGAETAMTVTVRGSEVTQASWPR